MRHRQKMLSKHDNNATIFMEIGNSPSTEQTVDKLKNNSTIYFKVILFGTSFIV